MRADIRNGAEVGYATAKRKHGGARPETIFIERYVTECARRSMTSYAMRKGFVHHVLARIEAGDPDCPFIAYDARRSTFAVWGAGSEERERVLANVLRSITEAEKRHRRSQP